MQLLFDFLPVIAFFVAYKLTDIFVATGVLIVAVIAQTGIQWLRHRKISSMALASALMVLVFGCLTLLIQDKVFIQWKVTVVNWLFAAALLGSHFIGGRPLTERMMGEHITLERSVWLRLSWAWIVFFLALGALNLYVAYTFAEHIWVDFKLGAVVLTVAFALAQAFWLVAKAQPKAG